MYYSYPLPLLVHSSSSYSNYTTDINLVLGIGLAATAQLCRPTFCHPFAALLQAAGFFPSSTIYGASTHNSNYRSHHAHPVRGYENDKFILSPRLFFCRFVIRTVASRRQIFIYASCSRLSGSPHTYTHHTHPARLRHHFSLFSSRYVKMEMLKSTAMCCDDFIFN